MAAAFETVTLVAFACALGVVAPSAHAQGSTRSTEQLEKDVAARDAAIADLVRRVRTLEERLNGAPPIAAPAASTQAPAARTAAATKTEQPADEASDEDALTRALERSLVLSGGLLLPRGSYELGPSLRYDYNRRSGLGIVGPTVTTRDVRRDNYLASLGVKIGLPWSSQLELSVPYGYQRVESITGGVSSTADHSGIGDIQIGASTQLLAPGVRRPGVIGNVTYQRATGQSGLRLLANPVTAVPVASTALGLGYDVLSTTVTAVKRIDPLVFLGSFSHSFNRSATEGAVRIDPSDTNSVTLRAILAASPNVSLRGGFSMARTGNTRLNGITIPGSRQNVALLELGGSIALTRRTLLDLSVAAGLTEESPNFVLGVSLPIRF